MQKITTRGKYMEQIVSFLDKEIKYCRYEKD